MEFTKEQFDELQKVKALYEKELADKEVAKKDAIEMDRFEKMKADIIAKIAPVQKRLEFVAGEPKERKEGTDYCKSFGEFLHMVKTNDIRLKTAMSTTSGQGGYTIPQEWSKDILNEMNNFATAPQKCTVMNMSAPTLHINSLLTDLTVAWSTEATDKSTTKPTFSQADLTLRYLYAIITMTKELSADSLIDMSAFLKNLVAQNIALELEAQILQANAAPFTGILNAVGVNAVAQVAGNLSYSDITAVVNNTGQLEQYKKNAVWYMTRGALNLVMNLKDLQNRPLFNMNNPVIDGSLPMILNYPVNISDQITDTLSAAGSTSIVFGDLKNVWIGKKAGDPDAIDVLWTNTAIISSSTSVTENLFLANKEALRFELRRGILVAIPAAFVKLTGVK